MQTDLAAEQAVLGAMLLEREAVARAMATLQRSDFRRPTHQALFDTIVSLYRAGKPADLVVVGDALKQAGRLESLGGVPYLSCLLDAAPTAAAIQWYAQILKRHATSRRLLRFVQRMEKRLESPDADPHRLAQAMQRAGRALARPKDKTPGQSLVRPYADFLAGEPPQVSWLVERLLPSGSLAILSGDAGVGKTWLLLHLAQCVAAGRAFLGHFACQPGRVLWWDEEGSEMLLRGRLAKLHAGLGLPDEPLPVHFLVGQGLRLDDESSLATLEDVLRQSRPTLVIVDSLTRVHSADENSASEVARIFAQVKRLSSEAQCAFLFTHHSRKLSAVSNHAGQRLRGSTDLRAVVDAHLFLRACAPGVLQIEHDKARYAEAVPTFSVTMADLPADEAGREAVTLTYQGEKAGPPSRRDVIAERIVSVIEEAGGSLDRPTLIERMKEEGVAERTAARAMASLVQEAVLRKERAGQRTLYSQAEEILCHSASP